MEIQPSPYIIQWDASHHLHKHHISISLYLVRRWTPHHGARHSFLAARNYSTYPSLILLVTLTYTCNQYIVFLMGSCFHNQRSIRTLTTSIYSSTKISHRLVEKPTTLLTALPNTVGRASKKALQVIRAASEPN